MRRERRNNKKKEKKRKRKERYIHSLLGGEEQFIKFGFLPEQCFSLFSDDSILCFNFLFLFSQNLQLFREHVFLLRSHFGMKMTVFVEKGISHLDCAFIIFSSSSCFFRFSSSFFFRSCSCILKFKNIRKGIAYLSTCSNASRCFSSAASFSFSNFWIFSVCKTRDCFFGSISCKRKKRERIKEIIWTIKGRRKKTQRDQRKERTNEKKGKNQS